MSFLPYVKFDTTKSMTHAERGSGLRSTDLSGTVFRHAGPVIETKSIPIPRVSLFIRYASK